MAHYGNSSKMQTIIITMVTELIFYTTNSKPHILHTNVSQETNRTFLISDYK
jgi:hypothetical protein